MKVIALLLAAVTAADSSEEPVFDSSPYSQSSLGATSPNLIAPAPTDTNADTLQALNSWGDMQTPSDSDAKMFEGWKSEVFTFVGQ